jgi:hypothetical protein
MARSADAATTVLTSLRVLYELGAEQSLADGDVIAALEQIGITGTTQEQEPYLAMLATMLRLLLRHADADPEAMFDATMADIDEEKFNEIVRLYDEH